MAAISAESWCSLVVSALVDLVCSRQGKWRVKIDGLKPSLHKLASHAPAQWRALLSLCALSVVSLPHGLKSFLRVDAEDSFRQKLMVGAKVTSKDEGGGGSLRKAYEVRLTCFFQSGITGTPAGLHNDWLGKYGHQCKTNGTQFGPY